MASSATWTSQLVVTGDMGQQTIPFNAANNPASPVLEQLVNLANGANTFAVPAAGTVVRLTIIPPSGNTTSITAKGVTGDTGIPLHKTDPTSIGIDGGFTQIVLTAGGAINNVRLVWN